MFSNVNSHWCEYCALDTPMRARCFERIWRSPNRYASAFTFCPNGPNFLDKVLSGRVRYVTAKVDQSTPEGRPSTVDCRLVEKRKICRLPLVVPLNKSTSVRARAPRTPKTENLGYLSRNHENRGTTLRGDPGFRGHRFVVLGLLMPWVRPKADRRPSNAEGRPDDPRRSTSRPPKVT